MRKRVSIRRWGLLLLATFSTLAIGATVYRWVDENGTTHYSDAAPAQGGATTVDLAPPAGLRFAPADWVERDEALVEDRVGREKRLDAAISERNLRAELEAISQGAGTPVPGETFAEPALQQRVLFALVSAEQAKAPDCSDHQVLDTESLGRDVESQMVFERWTVDRCGLRVAYRLDFRPDPSEWPRRGVERGPGLPPMWYVGLGEATSFTIAAE